MPASPEKVSDSARKASTAAASAGDDEQPSRSRTAPPAAAGSASFAAMAPSSRTVSAKTRRPPRRMRQRSMKRALRNALAHRGAAEHRRSRREAAQHRPRASTSMSRASRARSNRIVSCGSQASAPPGATSSSTRNARIGSERAIDFLGRRGGDDEAAPPRPPKWRNRKRSPPAIPPAVLTITASQSRGDGAGKAHAQRAFLMHAGAARQAAGRRARRAQCGPSRGWRRKSPLSLDDCPAPHAIRPQDASYRSIYNDVARRSAASSRLSRALA